MNQPYLFTDATLFGAGEVGDEVMYGRKNLMGDITEAVNTAGTQPTNITINNYVDSAENPEQFASRLSTELKLKLRTV